MSHEGVLGEVELNRLAILCLYGRLKLWSLCKELELGKAIFLLLKPITQDFFAFTDYYLLFIKSNRNEESIG